VSAQARAGFILKVVLVPFGVFVVAAAGLFLWVSATHGPMPEALAALRGTTGVKVAVGPWGVFEPVTKKPKIGLVIYPASRIDWRAYAPLALAIAGRGFLVVIVPMPLNLPALDIDRAQSVIGKYPTVRAWAIAGHGEGGAMAARFAARHPGVVRALILWAARPGAGDNLEASRTAVLSISGDHDGLVPPLVIKGSALLLPASTQWVTIPGANHSQFGWYGDQARDGKALISRKQQQVKVTRATVEMLRSIGG
jgi:pimeloyl-ACP methyl ester carboxylesterase